MQPMAEKPDYIYVEQTRLQTIDLSLEEELMTYTYFSYYLPSKCTFNATNIGYLKKSGLQIDKNK